MQIVFRINFSFLWEGKKRNNKKLLDNKVKQNKNEIILNKRKI